jgi:hypothetical protein
MRSVAAAVELLNALTLSDVDCAALIGMLHASANAGWLAELLTDLEGEDG